jgi:hypothetical protein
MNLVPFKPSGGGWALSHQQELGLYIVPGEEPTRYWVVDTSIGRVAISLDGADEVIPFSARASRDPDADAVWCGPASVELATFDFADPENLGSLRKEGQALHLRVYDGHIGTKEIRLEHADPYLHLAAETTYSAWRLPQERSNGYVSVLFIAGTWALLLD